MRHVVGQDEVKQHLLTMLASGKLPHALMLCGPRGVGKLPLALAFARVLLCEHPADGVPCGTCASCRMLERWAHPDLHFSFPIYKEGSNSRPTSDDFLPEWREQITRNPYFDTETWLDDIKAENHQITFYVSESDALQQKLALRASQGGRKVVIMWLPEKMSADVANKLLKIIEEPPLHTHFLLASEEPDMVLGTIQSRVQRVNVPPLNEEEIRQALVVGHAVPPALAEEVAHLAQGSFTAALKRLEAGREDKLFFDLFVRLMRSSYARRIKEMHEWAQETAALGRERQKRLLDYCQRLIRENFVHNFHRSELNYMTAEEQAFSQRFAPFVNERNVIPIMDELSDAARDIGQNVNPRMVFFDLALKMIVLLKQ